MSDKVIYTALFGNYEELKEPTVVTPGWRYICITDQSAQSEIWETVSLSTRNPIDQYNARLVKIKYSTTRDKTSQSIWIDASFQINCNLDEFWNKHYAGGITAPAHPARNCVYHEATICQRRGLDAANVANQIDRYSKEGLPQNNGLISSGILMRDNSEPVKDFCELWWKQIESGSLRDQIGFAYTDWKMPGVAHRFNYDYRTRQEFIYTKHYHARG